MIRIAAICASPKKQGQTDRYLNRFVRAAEKRGAVVKKNYLYDHPLPYFSGKLSFAHAKNTKTKLPTVPHLVRALTECDGIIIATPIHWFNVPVALKNLVDHMTVLEEYGYFLEGKVAGFIAYGPQGGATDVLQNLALVFSNMGCVFPPYSLIWFGQKQEQWAPRDIDLLAKNMILQIEAQRAQKISWDYA